MNKIKLVLLFSGLFSLLALSGYLGYKAYELTETKQQLNEQLQEANLEIGKAKTVITDKEIELDTLSEKLQKVLKDKDELVTEYNELVAKYNSSNSGTSTSNNSGMIHEKETYDTGHIYLAISKNSLKDFQPPVEFTYKDYHLDTNIKLFSEGNNLYLDIDYQLQLRLFGTLIKTIGPTGAINHYVELYELNSNGSKVNKLELEKFISVVKDERIKRFFWWAPHLDIGPITYFDNSFEFGSSIGLSLSGYGLTEDELIFRFARFGMLFSKTELNLNFSPVLWNFGKNLPLLSNFWIGPIMTYNLHQFGGGLFLGVQL